MDYDVYHDESQEAGYWHGILLVPKEKRSRLLDTLENIRNNINYKEPISFKRVSKSSGKKFQSVHLWLLYGVCALAQRLKGDPVGHLSGKIKRDRQGKREFEYIRFTEKIEAKFIVFRVRDHLKSLGEEIFEDHGQKVETTFGFGLKGGIHMLGDLFHPIRVTSFHFDGYQQYGRRLNLSYIQNRLTGLREYCSIASDVRLDDRSSDHREADCQSYEDCQLLQLTDTLVGAFRTVLGEVKNEHQKKASFPVKQLVDRWNRGYARMKHSKWHKGFCISECYREDGSWMFKQIGNKLYDSGQMSL